MTDKKIPYFLGVIILQIQETYGYYKRLVFPGVPVGYAKEDEAFITSGGLLRIMLFSVLCMAFAFLLVKALSILILTGLLRLNNINHDYALFNIYYLPGDESNWTDGSLLVVYGVPNLIFLTISMYLTAFVVRQRKLNWIFRLVLAWIAFQLMAYFLSELILAAFFYKGFGIALQWLISNYFLKIGIVIVGVIGIFYWSKRFGLMFLRCCPSRIFIDDPSVMRTWLIWVLLIPLFSGPVYLLLILFFSLKIAIASTFVAALITLPLAFRSIEYLPDVRIYKSKKVVPGLIFTLILMIALGIGVRLLIFFI
ncbi:MAG: hypothetical protein FD166_1570 [Bacteroidetes bacterium]|nr:MAG: hypothetical protein FD166_1570 [Bacteroidota bacterium]